MAFSSLFSVLGGAFERHKLDGVGIEPRSVPPNRFGRIMMQCAISMSIICFLLVLNRVYWRWKAFSSLAAHDIFIVVSLVSASGCLLW